MKSGVYLVTNIINGKGYVGSSKRLSSRWYEHKYLLRKNSHPNPHIQGAWNKDGESAFIYSILEYCLPEERIEREKWWVDLLDLRNSAKGYNKAQVGLNPMEGRRHSEETKSKMSAAMKGKPKSPEHIEKLSVSMMGKASVWMTGRQLSAEHKAKISSACKKRTAKQS